MRLYSIQLEKLVMFTSRQTDWQQHFSLKLTKIVNDVIIVSVHGKIDSQQDD